MKTSEFVDLNRLACERAQDAATLVTQLMDDDDAIAALLISVAVHFMDGASRYVAKVDGTNRETAKAKAVMAVISIMAKDQKFCAALSQSLREGMSCGD